MIERIVEIDLRFRPYERRLRTSQSGDGVTDREKRALQGDHAATQMVKLPYLLPFGMTDHFVFGGVDLVSDCLYGREIAVDDRINERVGEIVGLARPQAAWIAELDALAHGVERIARPL